VSESIKILQVLGDLDPGGTEVMIMNLYRYIDRTKVQFDFIIHMQEQCYFKTEIEQLGGHVYHVPRFYGFNIIQYRKAWKEFFALHRDYKAVHGHVGSSAAIYLKIAKQLHITTIAHSHGAKAAPNFKGFIYSLFAYPTRYIADRFFGCSYVAGTYRYGKKIVNSSRFSVIKNAIEVERFNFEEHIRDKVRVNLGVTNKFVVGHVGRFDPLKNHPFLLKIFKEVLTLHPDSLLLLVGDGPERAKIEKEIIALGLQEAVLLLGTRLDVPELLQAMDVFVFPSISEGLGIGLIEAQATGLPCITSTVVPHEVKITDLVEFLPLEMSAIKWAKRVLSTQKEVVRVNRHQEIIENGYDIKTSVLKLEKFYRDLNVQ